MKTKPILFNTEMVRAILDGRKTQARRVIKPQPIVNFTSDHSVEIEWLGVLTRKAGGRGVPAQELLDYFWEDICNQRLTNEVLCPYGQVGDRLWVRETWAINDVIPIEHRTKAPYIYRAELNERGQTKYTGGWKPSIHMPRAASRITLEVTGVRVERLQDISEEDAIAEGIESQIGFAQMTWYRDYLTEVPPGNFLGFDNAKDSFKSLWQSINAKKHPWDANPWVWVVEFKRVAIAGESSQ